MEGHLDEIGRSLVRGWVRDPASPGERISLLVTANGELVGRVLANRARPHLQAEGKEDGRYGFELHIVPPLSPLEAQVIGIRHEHDGAHMPGSPVVIAETTVFTGAMQGQLALILADTEDPAELDERLEFLAWQTDALLRRRAALRAGQSDRRLALVIAETWPPLDSDIDLPFIAALKQLGFGVHLVPSDMRAPPPDLPPPPGIVGCYMPFFASVEEVVSRSFCRFEVVVLHGISVAARYENLVRQHQGWARLVVDVSGPKGLPSFRQPDIMLTCEPADVAFAERYGVLAIDANAPPDQLTEALAKALGLSPVPSGSG